MAHSALVYVAVLRDLVAIVAADNAPETRTVYAVVVALGVVGVALAVLAIWLIRQTRPERELLAPLERMNDRAWRKQEPAQMRRDLDEVRPTDAYPVVRGQDVPEVDDEFAQSRPTLGTFDDLQAQLVADARHESSAGSSTGADPLLDNNTVDHSDVADELDGTVTHTGGGSAEIAALVAPAIAGAVDDAHNDRPADDDEPASTEAAD
jgi:hypothetical protein